MPGRPVWLLDGLSSTESSEKTLPNEFNIIRADAALSPAIAVEPSREDSIMRIVDGRSYIDSVNASYHRKQVSVETARIDSIRANHWPDDITESVIERKLQIGMTAAMVLASWGSPDHVNRTYLRNVTEEQWVYKSGQAYVYLENGIVKSIQSSSR
jgi:hypothetical protein